MPGAWTWLVARVSAITHGSLTPDQIMGEMAYADALRLYNQWWLDEDPKHHLRRAKGPASTKNVKGLFSSYGQPQKTHRR